MSDAVDQFKQIPKPTKTQLHGLVLLVMMPLGGIASAVGYDYLARPSDLAGYIGMVLVFIVAMHLTGKLYARVVGWYNGN